MRRLPVLPTLLVAAAVAVMIGLGVWQIQRAQWKEGLILKLEASSHGQRTTLSCTIAAKPEVRAGRSADGESGYRYIVPCTATVAGEPALPEVSESRLDIGWSKRPDALPYVRNSGTFTGVRAMGETPSSRLLVLDEPIPPLERSWLLTPADLPNNHLLYAIQWFFFAAAAAVIYFLALRRRNRNTR